MKYERLTERYENGRPCFKSIDACIEAVNRLAELEDKIENGTLVELPCKTGDEFYIVDTIYLEIETHCVCGFDFSDNKIMLINHHNCRYDADEDILYFRKEEAEAKLKELKGE